LSGVDGSLGRSGDARPGARRLTLRRTLGRLALARDSRHGTGYLGRNCERTQWCRLYYAG
jgi:hypothetical protein